MSYEVKQGNIFGRIGSGIGQGLAEQLPKEIERGRLASGLEKFQQNSLEKTPAEQAVDFYKIPGVTAEMGYTLFPLLSQQRRRKAAIDYGKSQVYEDDKQDQSPYTSPGPSRNSPAPYKANKPQNAPRSITNLDTEQELLRPNLPPKPAEVNALAGKLIEQNLERFLEPGDAIEEAKKILDSDYNRRETLRNQAKINDQAKSEIEQEFKKITGDLKTTVDDEVLQEFLNSAYEDVANGKETKLSAANKYAKNALSLSKDITSLQKLGSSWFPNPSSSKKAIEEIRQKFKGRPELFNNLLQSKLGFSPHFAGTLASPIRENKEINNELSKVKKVKSVYDSLKNADNDFPEEKKIANSIGKHLKPGDSILAIALDLYNKGYDEQAFVDEIGKLKRKGLISLSDYQARELEDTAKVKPSLNDRWFFTLSGLENLVEQK